MPRSLSRSGNLAGERAIEVGSGKLDGTHAEKQIMYSGGIIEFITLVNQSACTIVVGGRAQEGEVCSGFAPFVQGCGGLNNGGKACDLIPEGQGEFQAAFASEID